MTDTILPAESQQQPYYDDYDGTKGFHRILFRPGRAVQARELTQLQTILQKQIARFGTGIYTNGSIVSGGEITYQGRADQIMSLNLNSTYANTTILAAPFMFATINSTSNAVAVVLATEELNSTEPATIVIKPKSGSKVSAGDTISIVKDILFANAAYANVTAVGTASIVSINSGVYFYNGFFIAVEPQSIILDKYDDTPSFRVGLEFDETILDENSDTSLLDPAQEASNFQAPGATRYQLGLTLAKRDLSSIDDTHFIELLRVEDGVIKAQVQYPVYSDLAATMARRTFDESGNYTVRPFLVELSEHIPELIDGTVNVSVGSGTVNGTNTSFVIDTSVNSNVFINSQSSIVTAVGSNNSMTISPVLAKGAINSQALVQNPDKFSVKLSAGKAYVKGYEFETVSPTAIGLSKGRAYSNVTSYDLDSPLGNYVTITSMKGIADINNMEVFDIHVVPSSQVNLISSPLYSTTLIGNTKIRAIEYSGAANTSNALTHIYTAYLFDVNISNNTYSMNNSIGLVSHLSTVSNVYNRLLDIDISSKSNNALFGNTVMSDTAFNTLIFPFPQSTIKAGSITNVDYQYRKLVSSVSFVAGQATVTVSAPDSFVGSGTLSDAEKLTNFVLTVRDKGALPAGWSNGDIIPLTTTLGRSVTVSPITSAAINTGLANNFVCDVLYSVNITGVAPSARVKTRVSANTGNVMSGGTGTVISTTNTTVFLTNTFAQVQITNANNVNKTTGLAQKLYVADIINISKVYDFGAFNITQANLASALDVTTSFILDNGQRDGYYDHGSLSLKPGANPPTGQLLVYLDFYTHSGTSGYLTVDSYPLSTTNAGYTAIPSYTSPSTGKVYQLRDSVDWRPVRQNAVETFTLLNAKILEPGHSFISDFSYYLARIDKIVLTQDRIFKVIQGVPSLYPEVPTHDSNDMLLYTLKVPPFTFNVGDVDVRFNENKRYTMRDIGKLEKRIENLEYYTSLNLLEKDADSLVITDSAGLTRFKNGIVVDSFTGHQVGDVGSYDYYCAMDFENGELHAPFISNNTTFLVNGVTNAVNKGGQITLDYTLDDFIVQDLATDYDNVNPYNYTTWIGTLKLLPDNDTWYDTTVRPQVLVNLEGENDAWEEIGDVLSASDTRPNGFGTRYNDWQTTWSGVTGVDVQTSSSQYKQDGALYQQDTTRTTTSTTDLQTRQVTTKTVVPETITKSVGDSVVDVSVLPYIRKKDIVLFSNSVKPATVMFPFFDGVSVLGYWRQPTLLRVSFPYTGYFNSNSLTETVTSNTGGMGLVVNQPRVTSIYANTATPAFWVVNTQGAFSANDTITGVSGGTASIIEVINLSGNVASVTTNTSEVIIATNPPSATIMNLLINNIITFPKGNGLGQIRTITGYNVSTRAVSLDRALDTPLTANTVYSLGAPVSDMFGIVAGTLHIPNNTKLKFFTGTKNVRMTSSPTNSTDDIATYADGTYYAQGLMETTQQTLVSVRVPQIVTNTTGEERTVSSDVTTSDTTTQLISRDPVPVPDPVPVVVPDPPPAAQDFIQQAAPDGPLYAFENGELKPFYTSIPANLVSQQPGFNPNDAASQQAQQLALIRRLFHF